MEIRHLRLVYEVARLGTLSKASEKLFLTQSALSHQLRELETELGRVVFHRINNKMVLSDAGALYLRYAENILAQLDELDAYFNEKDGTKLGRIRIGIEAYSSYHWIPGILKAFNSKHPNIEVSLNTGYLTTPLQMIKQGKLDFALVIFRDPGSSLLLEPIFSDELVVIVSSRNTISNREYVTLEDLAGETLVTHSKRNERHKILESTQGEEAINFSRYVHVSHTQTILEMVAEGLGVALLSKWAVMPYLDPEKVCYLPLGPAGTFRDWYLAYLGSKTLSRYEADFLKLLREQLPMDQER